MTDPLRRDPREFSRALKLLARNSSWQKCLLFASRGRQIGFHLGLDHYNTILFSQAMWGRSLEIVKVIRQMQADRVKMNGISYYYVCQGMSNVDHGYCFDYPVNERLSRIHHWRIALEALAAAEHNGFDANDLMYSACAIACTIPGTDKWKEALLIAKKMSEDERKPHPNMIKFMVQCLTRNQRPREASALLRHAAELKVAGYEDKWEPDIFRHLPTFNEDDKSTEISDPEYYKEQAILEQNSANVPFDQRSVFRPRVYRQLWYKWHAIANKYRPTETLKKRQLAPPDSPCGIPGFYRV